MYKKVIIILSISIILTGLLASVSVYYIFFKPNVLKSYTLIIDKGENLESIASKLKRNKVIISEKSFMLACNYLTYPKGRRGKYSIRKNENNYKIINMLRAGQHRPVKFTFNSCRNIENIVDKTKNRFFFNYKKLSNLIKDSATIASYGFDNFTISAMFIPDSYEIYYDISEKEFLDKIFEFYHNFWDGKRVSLCESLNLTPVQVATLASIVEEESSKVEEYPIIAGLYINRLHKGMPLQADPTVKFAVGDVSLTRILNFHLQTESPYNTYKHNGLPPGPIRIASPRAIDAVINYKLHNYLYMCAKEDFSGYHNFATTNSEHEKNAKKYHTALSKLQKSRK